MVFMGESVVAEGPVLSDSLTRTRPEFTTYMRSDANAKGTVVSQIEQSRLERQMKFPSLSGRKDVDSFNDPQNLSNPAFKKYNDQGDHRADAPFRSCDNMIDPVSGFVSVAGDKDRGTGHNKISSMVQLNNTPQSYNPRELTSIRLFESAPPDTRRETDRDPGASYPWNSRKVLDSSLRAKLGGWTSARDPRQVEAEKVRGDHHKKPAETARDVRDNLALKFMYTSSAQRAYEEVPWDNMARPRQWSHPTTLEEKPDMISQVFTKKRYEPAAKEWQNTGRSWDWFQTRKGHFKQNIPIPGTVFCSPCSRSQQIPNYGGCIGGENILEIENANEPFTPFTVKRVPIPRPSDTSHRPNIPLYTGCTLYTADRVNHAMHSKQPAPEPQTTARVHRSMPVTPNSSDYRKRSFMSKMVTTVPPSNPFNRINKEPINLGGGDQPMDLGEPQNHMITTQSIAAS